MLEMQNTICNLKEAHKTNRAMHLQCEIHCYEIDIISARLNTSFAIDFVFLFVAQISQIARSIYAH